MICYPLVRAKGNTKLLFPRCTMNNEAYVQNHYDLYLTAEGYRKFRLHAKQPHCIDDYLSYDIKCPHCGELLVPIGAPLNYYDLGLYFCRACLLRFGGNRND